MRTVFAIAFGAAMAATGCMNRVETVPVTLVPTHTAGVMFVVVHPSSTSSMPSMTTEPGDGKRVIYTSDYLLLCDGRKGDGMRCEVASEAALRRFSFAPAANVVGPDVNEGVGTLTDLSVSHDGERGEHGEHGDHRAHPPDGAPPTPTPSTPDKTAPAPTQPSTTTPNGASK